MEGGFWREPGSEPPPPLSGVTLGKPVPLFQTHFPHLGEREGASLVGFGAGEPHDINRKNGRHFCDGNDAQARHPDAASNAGRDPAQEALLHSAADPSAR